MNGIFSDLPDFLKEYIHGNRWASFRDIQETAFDAVCYGDSDVLIVSGTSSGKTEAAFLPILSTMHRDPAQGVGVLYISPLKALINDQYGRLSLLLRSSGIRVTGWHGDVDSDIKAKVRKSPEGILQMTPESLQALVGGDPGSVPRMFPDLRFVIIDEMHAFMGSERGLQLLCCLDRVERTSGCHPRRIGLSATLYDTSVAEDWIRAGRQVTVTTIRGDEAAPMRVAISLHRFPGSGTNGGADRRAAVSDYYRAMYRVTDRNRCLLFTNTREVAERTHRSLDAMVRRLGDGRTVLLHHGRLPQETRRSAEMMLNSDRRNVTVVSTSTLELGVDIGQMDRIVQIDAPHGCSSLLQRMGRSGRRGGTQSLVIMCREDEERGLPEEVLRMNLVKSLAEVQLSVDEGWCEPPEVPSHPYGLLFHQTLEYMRGTTGVRWSDLERDVLTQYPFRSIPREDYRELLRHMVRENALTVMEDDTLLIGPVGERVAFGKDFHTVFRPAIVVEVRCGEEIVGTLEYVPEPGDIVRFDDMLWIVRHIDAGGRYAEAEPVDGGIVTGGRWAIPEIHPIVMDRMRRILSSDEMDERLTGAARESIVASRALFADRLSVSFGRVDGLLRICPWNGTKGFRTVRCALESMGGVRIVRSYEPFIIDVRTELSPESVRNAMEHLLSTDPMRIVAIRGPALRFGKYDRFVPDRLLLKEYVSDRLRWRSDILPF